MILLILILVICCYNIFGGWGILVSIGIFAFILFSPNPEETRRKDVIEANRAKIVNVDPRDFRSTKSIENAKASDYGVYVDEISQKIMFVNFTFKIKQIYRFDEIIECSILEDGAAIQTGGIGRAVAGGFIAGGAGAIVGASTRKTTPVTYSLSVRVVTANIQKSLYEIPLITSKTDKETSSYRAKFQFAQEVYAVVTSAATIAKRQQVQR